MPRRSSITRLGPEIAALVARLHADGLTIDAVRQRLREMGVTVSRSALGRHIQRLSAPCPVGVAEELREVRASLDRLAASMAGLPGELKEIRHADILAFKAATRAVTEEIAQLRVILARSR
jgi:hypothetical protein